MRAATTAFVRTEAGVVRVGEGDPLPDGADQAHVERLTAAGVFADPGEVDLVEAPPSTGDQATDTGRGGGSRRRGGSSSS